MENIAESPYNVTQISVVTQQIIHMLSFRITIEFYKYCAGRSKKFYTFLVRCTFCKTTELTFKIINYRDEKIVALKVIYSPFHLRMFHIFFYRGSRGINAA